MNTHVKISDSASADLSRRSFLVGSAATGLVLGYAAVPGIDQALAAPSAFEPSVWYSIAPDGLVTVTCGKADMGQHIASTMAQIVAEELGASWKDMRVQLASNDPKFNDPVLGAQITGGSWSTMMNFDAMSRAGAAGRMVLIDAAAAAMGIPPFNKGDHPLQKAWILEQVPQCGYCQSGQIMQAASLLSKNSNPTKDEVVAHMDGNLCRCMTYSRIQKAIMRAASEMRTASNAGTERRAT
jgi:hypothetical protein